LAEEVARVAARVKVIDLAKELGVTSKDLIVALEGMGHKGMRAMSPLLAATANELRVAGPADPPRPSPSGRPPKAAEATCPRPRRSEGGARGRSAAKAVADA
jgi:translation initiation factor IF-2